MGKFIKSIVFLRPKININYMQNYADFQNANDISTNT